MTQVSNDISFALTTMEDLAARKQAEEALRRSEHHLSNFFNQSPVGLEWLSASGVILRTNQAQLEMLGYSAKEYLGHFFTEFCEAPALGLELLKRLTAEETVRNFRLAQRRKDGGICHVLVDAVSFRMDGQFQYSSIFLRDITARVNLEREVLHVSEWEHRRIAQDLHDGLGQLLVGTVHLTSALQKELAVKSLSDSRYLHRILKLLNEAVAQTRSLARGLHPVEPESDGLMASLEALAKRTKSLFQVACRFHYQRPVLIYDNAVATHLYRIAQEAITNAIKHAKPKRIEISLSETAGRINLTIRDDGTGLPAHRRKEPGMGLRIMRYRAGMIGGSLAVEKEDRRGTKVTCSVRLPVGNVSDRPAPARRRKK
jgi:PAS domain S-box-containing protein